MNYKIEEKGPFKVFGVEAIIDSTNGNNFINVPQFWDKCYKDGTLDRLDSIEIVPVVKGLCKVNSVMCYRCMGDNAFPYMIGVVDFEGNAKVPEGLTTVSVKPYTWAIFRTEDHTMANASEKMQAVWKRIFPEWFPTSGYEHDDGPELELTYQLSKDKLYTEIWIPVVKK